VPAVKVVSVKVDDDTKRAMEGLSDVNWSEVLRGAIRARVELEQSLRIPIDRRRALAAGRAIDAFRASVAPSDFDSTKEIRKWRDRNWRS